MTTLAERAKRNYVTVEYQAALERVEARGIKKHSTHEFETALREELGISVTQAEAAAAAIESAADARLAKGESDLHAARVDAAEGRLR